MKIAPFDSECRREQNQPLAPPALAAILPDDLIPEILSYLDVKSLLKLRCVCKAWKSLISDPKFVQLHLKRSQRNPHLAIYTKEWNERDCVVPFPISRLLDNPLITLPNDPCYRLMDKDWMSIVDSCNGLICLQGKGDENENWFYLWNPASRKVSEKFGCFRDLEDSFCFHYMFGYDKSSCTYKLVTLTLKFHVVAKQQRTDVKVFSLGDNVWRVIHNLPLVPMFPVAEHGSYGADFRGSLNWLALRTDIGSDSVDNWKNCSVEQFVISSFDMDTEACTQFMPPPSFDEVPHIKPHICVLVDCLCFSYDVKGTHFVIWKMTEFRVQESWTQFLKISYQNVGIDSNFDNFDYPFLGHRCWTPLHISGNGDIVILSRSGEDAAIIYNLRDNTVKKTRTSQYTLWFYSRNYVESLVSPL